MTFSKAYDKAPRVIITAGNSETADIKIYRQASKQGFSIATNNPLIERGEYELDYIVIQ